MTPEQLACVGTNTQLEPIRRAIEAAVPSYNTVFDHDAPPPVRTCTFSDTSPNFSSTVVPPGDLPVTRPTRRRNNSDEIVLKHLSTTTSLENPLLRLTEKEYKTLRRYQDERSLPDRFIGATSAQQRSLTAPLEPPPKNPTYSTTASEYGKFAPNIHTMPFTYHGLNTKFTAKKTEQGNYRNHSLNL